MNLRLCSHPCYAALGPMAPDQFRLHLLIYLSLHPLPPWWKVSKMMLKLCFLAENFLQVKFPWYEMRHIQYALSLAQWEYLKGKQQALDSEGCRETNLVKPCLFFLPGCPPVLVGAANTMPRNMFAVPVGDQWSRVQACSPAMFCLAFGSTDLSAVFTRCATTLSFVWVTSQPASYTS